MFGYIEPEKSQLRLWEYEQYRGVYCGLCKSMGKHTGQLSRLSLNYDYVFLAMIRTALTGAKPEFKPFRCMLHPMQKRALLLDDNVLKYCSDVSAMLTYHKVLDNIADSSGAKKLLSILISPISRSIFKRSDTATTSGEFVAQKLQKMAELEKSNASPDELADVFGEIMSEILVCGLEDKVALRIAHEIGKHMGRYIYLADALDDALRDSKTGEFNPFLNMYGKDGLSEIPEKVKTAILLELKELESAINLVDFSSCLGYEGIIKNIIYLGMPQRIGKILNNPPYSKEKIKDNENK